MRTEMIPWHFVKPPNTLKIHQCFTRIVLLTQKITFQLSQRIVLFKEMIWHWSLYYLLCFVRLASSVVPVPGTFTWPQAPRGKPRRGMLRRAVFSDLQRKALERTFQKQKYISKPDRKKLACKLGLKDSQVHIWDYQILLPLFQTILLNNE